MSDPLENAQFPTVLKKSLRRQARCQGTQTVDVLPSEKAQTGSTEPLVIQKVSFASWLKLLYCCWPLCFFTHRKSLSQISVEITTVERCKQDRPQCYIA